VSAAEAPPEPPRVSIIVTVYNEGAGVVPCLDRICEAVTLPYEILVVYDSPDDTSRPFVEEYARHNPLVIPTLNTLGRGPAFAIRFGVDRVRAGVFVITMADGSDDPHQIDALTHLVERGVAIASASRYMRGGQQIGAPFVKRTLSRGAGLSLHYLARVGTHDATNSFKAYSTDFVRSVGIVSDAGFEVALELVAKSRRLRLPIAEVPTIWLEREGGESKFALAKWLPRYLYWYRYAFGGRLTLAQVAQADPWRKHA